MAITVHGVEADLGITEWAEYMEAHAKGSPSPAAVISGGIVSSASGTRLVSVSAGTAYVPGCLVEWDATTVTVPANSTPGTDRIDYIALQVDWSGTAATAGTLIAIPGTPAVDEGQQLPNLTRTAGAVWQLPLATLEPISASTGQITAGHIDRVWSSYADTGHVPVDFFTGWVQGAPPLAVCRTAGVVEFGGAFYRTVGIGAGVEHDLGRIIPRGFRPRRTVEIEATANKNGTPRPVVMTVFTDGFVSVRNTSTTTITPSERIRPTTTTWLPEV